MKTKPKYMLIENTGIELFTIQETFNSVTAARKWIERDADDTCEGLPPYELETPFDWGNNYYICEVVQVVRPVPRVKVSVKIELIEVEK